MFSLLLTLVIIVSLLLVLVIMVQKPKGGGLSSAITGTGDIGGGIQKTTDFLDKSTWTLATFLLVLILVSNVLFSPRQNSETIESQQENPVEVPQG